MCTITRFVSVAMIAPSITTGGECVWTTNATVPSSPTELSTLRMPRIQVGETVLSEDLYIEIDEEVAAKGVEHGLMEDRGDGVHELTRKGIILLRDAVKRLEAEKANE